MENLPYYNSNDGRFFIFIADYECVVEITQTK